MNEISELDPEAHADDTVVSVWKRRAVLVLLILLVVAVSAPAFSGCGGALATKKTIATYEVAGRAHDVTDEDLGRFIQQFDAAGAALNFGRLPEGDEGAKEALRLMMIDAAAKADGVRVPDSVIAGILARMPQFQVGGKFDEARYRSVLAEFGGRGLTSESMAEILRVELRCAEYQQSFVTAFDLVPGEDAYESWKKRNVKLTVDYVASPYETQREKYAAAQPTDEDLAAKDERGVAFIQLPAIRQILAVPPSKTVETAYLRVEDLTPERFEAAKKFALDTEILSDDRPLTSLAFVLFHDNKETVFTKEHWAQASDPGYPERKRVAQEKHAAWEKLSKEEREKQTEPPPEKDPAADYPEEVAAQAAKWEERCEKEVIAREIVKYLGQRAEREGRTLEEVGAEYARFGVKVVKNGAPLPDSEIVEKYPDPVARDSEFDQVVIHFIAPAEGAVFKPQFHSEPVPTTRLANRMQDRGYMVLRLDSCDPSRFFKVEEKRDAVVEVWRKRKVATAAKEILAEIKKKADEPGADVAKRAATLRTAAAEAGLSVQTLLRFNSRTESPRPPVAGPDQKLAPEVEAVARRIALRNYVQMGYQLMSGMEPGKFVDPHWIDDDKMQAALLVLIIEKREPGPVEMQDADVAQERYVLLRQSDQKRDALFGFDAVAKRYSLQRFDEKSKKPELKPPAEKPN